VVSPPRPRESGPSRALALPPPLSPAWNWQLLASCRGYPVQFFFPEQVRGIALIEQEATAKRICVDCPVLAQCRDHALRVPEAWGIWGAMTPRERGIQR
jgi:WhiB family redox-sensing transcriptional regulator